MNLLVLLLVHVFPSLILLVCSTEGFTSLVPSSASKPFVITEVSTTAKNWLSAPCNKDGFALCFCLRRKPQRQIKEWQERSKIISTKLFAGGFEWVDPTDTTLDPGVNNPYKNPELLEKVSDADGIFKIDAARLLSPRLSGSNVYFIGMMGSGKSSVGKIVAKRMGSYTFLDTDEIIEKATNMTIPEIFKTEGEQVFRDVESQVLNSVYAYVRCVISTGGGIVCRRENWSKLQSGIVVWLDADPELIMKRIEGTDRPLLQTSDPLQTIKDLLNERKQFYSVADVRIPIVDTSESEEEVAERVVRTLHDYIDDNPPAWKQAKYKAQADGLDWVR